MENLVLLKCGELILKGHNRAMFENRLVKNIKSMLKGTGQYCINRSQGTIFVEIIEGELNKTVTVLKRVFGITKLSPAYTAPKDIDAICAIAKEKFAGVLSDVKTFKVRAKRADKTFPMGSPEIAARVGGELFHHFDHLEVDLKNPDIYVTVDIRGEYAYLYCENIPGMGGMPTGTNGKATLLLSGGIDSPVAGWMMAKRGLYLDAVHFFSHPYTSERAKEKVLDLAKILSGYADHIRVSVVPFTEIQLALMEKCPGNQMVILMRRFMTRIAQRIAQENGSSALITGESLGQVASQTLQSLVVTNDVAEIPVFRPLIGLDKEEIIRYARRIGTFETSILPYEDCCTIFVPKHPETKPKLDRIKMSEQNLDYEALVQRAIDGVEVVDVSYHQN